MAEQKMVICPYCGDAQALAERCRACGGLFEPLSRQATHNAMGPWFVRDPDRPFQPGCSFDTLLRLIERGRVTKFTIVRGPTTRQFWTIAKHVPGLSHLLGFCHQCDASVDAGDHSCHACGATFGTYMDRNYLGLPEIQPLPWETGGQEQLRQPLRQQGQIWRHAADGDEPRTISSFVSDDELLGTGEHAGGALPASFGGATAVEQQQQEAVETATEGDDEGGVQPARVSPVATATPRTMHRSVAQQQQRTIRILLASTVALGMLVITFSFGWFNTIFAPQGGHQPVSVPEASTRTESARAAGQAAVQPAEPASSHATVELLAGYERAIGLIESAGDEQRALTERIAAYEQALKLLTAIKAEADPVHWPADLQERVDVARTQLDRLRLREFFP